MLLRNAVRLRTLEIEVAKTERNEAQKTDEWDNPTEEGEEPDHERTDRHARMRQRRTRRLALRLHLIHREHSPPRLGLVSVVMMFKRRFTPRAS